MDTEPKKLVLVYPPYSTATSPPLGVCSLKGFIERTLPDWSVKVMDLNLLAHQELLDRLAVQSSLTSPNLRGDLPETLIRGAQIFRGEHPEDFYGRPERYFRCLAPWLQAMPAAPAPAPVLQRAYRSGPLPASATQHADCVLRQQPAMVGISICYSQQLWPGLCLAKAIRERAGAGLPIVLGGTFFNSGVNATWVEHQASVDYVVSGEGERPLAAILSGRGNESGLPGVTCLHNPPATPAPPAIEHDLDSLGEPDFSDLDLRAYYSPQPVLPLLTSRGCYWRRCAFCAHYKSAGQTYRLRSIPAVIDELRRHVAAGVRHFALIDEMIAPPRFAQLADAIAQAQLDVRYYALAKPVKQFDGELLGRMYRSGCRYLLWGLESGSQRVLDLIDKGTNIPDIEQVLTAATAAGIRNHVFVIAGFPTETREEFQATLAFLERHRAHIAAVHRGPFQLEEGSLVFDHPEKFSITRHWAKPGSQCHDFECAAGMNRQVMMQLLVQAIPFLRSFASPCPQLGDFRFRDHSLLVYSH